MRCVVVRLFAEDSGQDLIEYALLTGMVTATTVAVCAMIGSRMSSYYSQWATSTDAGSIQGNWQPADPNSSGS
jgi:Flp pilus assembly pilin Flp